MENYTHLTRDDRIQIQAFLKAGSSQTQIAKALGVNKSTISRELSRNQGTHRYFGPLAHRLALDRRRGKSYLRIQPETWALVEDRLCREQWSPEQISGRLKRTRGLRVSHESIYRHIWADTERGGTLHKHLRRRYKYRRRRGGRKKRAGPIANRVGIEERPAIVESRERVGDWETDTILGTSDSKEVLASYVDRCARFTRLAKAARRGSQEVMAATLQALGPLADRVHTITADNGSEFARHGEIASALKALFFFANPYAAWERGLNENTNGLVRQYFPKGCDFSTVSDEQIQEVEDKLNNRPRKCLGYRTPNEVFCPP